MLRLARTYLVYLLAATVYLCWTVPAAGDLFVTSNSTNSVLRYDERTGQFLGAFVAGRPGEHGPSGLLGPLDLTFGPDGNLYVAGNNARGQVLRFDGQSGAFLDVFAALPPGGVARGLAFGPDGHLYVSDSNAIPGGRVVRFDGRTGGFLDVLTSPGLDPEGLAFGPDGHLYVVSATGLCVKRYDAATAQFMDDFVSDSGGTQLRDLVFGPDGHLYVSSYAGPEGGQGVRRYDGRTGALLDIFAPGHNLLWGLAFGPDGHLYAARYDDAGRIKRFDGGTGAFLDDFVTSGEPNAPDWLVGPTAVAFGPQALISTPEPPSWFLLVLGALGLLLHRLWFRRVP